MAKPELSGEERIREELSVLKGIIDTALSAAGVDVAKDNETEQDRQVTFARVDNTKYHVWAPNPRDGFEEAELGETITTSTLCFDGDSLAVESATIEVARIEHVDTSAFSQSIGATALPNFVSTITTQVVAEIASEQG